MYNVPKTISLTILLKEANRELTREMAYILPRVSDEMNHRKIERGGLKRRGENEKFLDKGITREALL